MTIRFSYRGIDSTAGMATCGRYFPNLKPWLVEQCKKQCVFFMIFLVVSAPLEFKPSANIFIQPYLIKH